MDLRMLWATTLVLSVIVSRSPGAWAQSNNVATCPPGWEWNENSLGQDPCLIASLLEANCRSSLDYGITPLQSGQGYVPPSRNSTEDLACECDTVMYSLYMACSTCQHGFAYSWIRWASQCDTTSVTTYPHDIPHGTAIPRWAFYDVTTLPNQTYDGNLAVTIGRDPEATPKPMSTITQSSSSTRRSSSSSSPSVPSQDPVSSTSPSSTNDATVKKNNSAVIIGGVVGGVVPLIILAVIAGFCLGRRKRRERTEEMPNYYKEHPASPTLTATSIGLPYSTYNNHGYQGRASGYGGMPEM